MRRKRIQVKRKTHLQKMTAVGPKEILITKLSKKLKQRKKRKLMKRLMLQTNGNDVVTTS